MQEKEHILSLLEKLKLSIEKKDSITIKSLSNHIVHHSSVYQDPDVILLAVMIYSLSKIIERNNYNQYKNWDKFYSDYISSFDEMIKFLKKDDIGNFRKSVANIMSSIQKLTGQLKEYISEVFRKAKINKASRIYEHGISMEKTAKILGISIWELSGYIGETNIGDLDLSQTMPIQKRINLTKEIFR